MSNESRQQFCGDLGVPHEGLAVEEVDGKQFHILEDRTPAYKKRYERAEYFQQGLAWVREGEIWIRINKQGIEVPMKHTSSVI